jgi:hypothetical protein
MIYSIYSSQYESLTKKRTPAEAQQWHYAHLKLLAHVQQKFVPDFEDRTIDGGPLAIIFYLSGDTRNALNAVSVLCSVFCSDLVRKLINRLCGLCNFLCQCSCSAERV